MDKGKDTLVGTRIANCQIGRRIGAGGMGAVYLAHHVGLNKPVAVKILSLPVVGQDDYVHRFMREAQTAARLEHPNIVQVFDVGESSGIHYLTMQYIEGKSLERILEERGKLPLAQAVAIGKRIAMALAAAHKAGVVHRDIKPANVLVSKEGVVKVVDFGLARHVESGQTISSTGQIIGTPHYMAPEQAKGEKVDARTDIYSLGATLYHVVTGSKCFRGDTPLAIVLKQIQEQPPPVHTLNPELPPALSAIIAKMMAKDPAGRHATAEEVVRALDGLKTGGETVVGAAAPKRRSPAAIAAGAIAAVVVVAAVAWALARDGAPAPVDPPAPPKTEAPKPPPPEETGLVRGQAKALEKFRDRASELADAKDVLKRYEEFVTAVKNQDERAWKEFFVQRAPPAMRGEREKAWRQLLETFVAEMRRRSQEGAIEFSRVLNVEFVPTPMGGPRCVVTVENTSTPPKGGKHVSPPQDVAWFKDGEKWYMVPAKGLPK